MKQKKRKQIADMLLDISDCVENEQYWRHECLASWEKVAEMKNTNISGDLQQRLSEGCRFHLLHSPAQNQYIVRLCRLETSVPEGMFSASTIGEALRMAVDGAGTKEVGE